MQCLGQETKEHQEDNRREECEGDGPVPNDDPILSTESSIGLKNWILVLKLCLVCHFISFMIIIHDMDKQIHILEAFAQKHVNTQLEWNRQAKEFEYVKR